MRPDITKARFSRHDILLVYIPLSEEDWENNALWEDNLWEEAVRVAEGHGYSVGEIYNGKWELIGEEYYDDEAVFEFKRTW